MNLHQVDIPEAEGVNSVAQSSSVPNSLQPLADKLGVSVESLAQLGVVRKGDAWLYPERDACAQIVGHHRRFDDGTKKATPGSRRGLCYALGKSWALSSQAGASSLGPILIPEGMSDTAAALDLAFDAVGRSTASPGHDEMAWLVELMTGRHVVVVGEHDGSGAGVAGAEKTAAALVGNAASVKVIYPPLGVKDLRSWVVDHAANMAEIEAAIRGVDEWSVKPLKVAGEPSLICMNDIEPMEIDWLWPGRIAMGRMTLIVGRPGDGKSFVTAAMAANVSLGIEWPDGTPCPMGTVILCSAEDDPADTIAPRLIAHGADRSKIHCLTGVMMPPDPQGNTHEKVFTLADLDALRLALERHKDCKLIVIDPIGSYLGGQADAHRDNEVRSVLAPACKLAQEYGAALVMVAHTRKSSAANADDMAMGSRAFTGLARSVLHLMADPQDPTKKRRLLLPGKNNLSEKAAGLAFDIGSSPTCVRPRVNWHEGEVDMTADEAVNFESAGDNDQQTAKEEAMAFLQQKLVDGPQPAREIAEEAKEARGISAKTLQRARKELEIVAYRPDNPGPWWWRLPAMIEHMAKSQRDDTWPSGLLP